jgi:hypothetical protein
MPSTLQVPGTASHPRAVHCQRDCRGSLSCYYRCHYTCPALSFSTIRAYLPRPLDSTFNSTNGISAR